MGLHNRMWLLHFAFVSVAHLQDMKVIVERKKKAEIKELEKLEREKQLESLKQQVIRLSPNTGDTVQYKPHVPSLGRLCPGWCCQS